MTLEEFFREYPRTALGFSGGVDSAYLLYEGVRLGCNIQPYFVKTVFQPAFELEDAQRLSKQLGLRLKVIEVDILSQPGVAENPFHRCYYCKTALFTALKQRAAADGFEILLDGTNASDIAADRPGMKALLELAVRSPLRECGLTKDMIRQRSQMAGLFTWDKPAYACLATRIPTGNAITPELLGRIEAAENALFSLGFLDFRVRIFHGAARLQFTEAQLPIAAAKFTEIRLRIRPYFDTVLLDLEGR